MNFSNQHFMPIVICSGKYFYFILEKYHLIVLQSGKTTTIRRIAVRETCISRHHGSPITGSLEPFGPLQDYRIEGFYGLGGPLIGPQ